MSIHERTALLIGEAGLAHLAQQHVLIAGVGGVGGYAIEALARAGVGKLTLLDHDQVSESNRNRQIIALASTLGEDKTTVMQARIADINPDIQVVVKTAFLQPDHTAALLNESDYDYVIDCIDSIACKAALVEACLHKGIPVASSMGAGGRLDVSKVMLSTLDKTHTCPLAREMRKRLRSTDRRYPVVFSTETPKKGTEHRPVGEDGVSGRPRSVNGTISYLPSLFGLMLAGFVIQQLLSGEQV